MNLTKMTSLILLATSLARPADAQPIGFTHPTDTLRCNFFPKNAPAQQVEMRLYYDVYRDRLQRSPDDLPRIPGDVSASHSQGGVLAWTVSVDVQGLGFEVPPLEGHFGSQSGLRFFDDSIKSLSASGYDADGNIFNVTWSGNEYGYGTSNLFIRQDAGALRINSSGKPQVSFMIRDCQISSGGSSAPLPGNGH